MAALVFFVMYMIIVMHDWSGDHSKELPPGITPPPTEDESYYR